VDDSCVLWFTTTAGVDGERLFSDCIDFIFGINGHIGRTGTPLLRTMEFSLMMTTTLCRGFLFRRQFCISLVSVLRTNAHGESSRFLCAAFFFFAQSLDSIGVLLAIL